ncbi:MAG TPA: hypothetical protein EYP40_12230 [Chromatiales bacterium]|nr:hypothetical protein [Chromatiales bacterium]
MPASLILHPADPEFAPPSADELASKLRAIGLIGAAWGEPDGQRYLIGEHFLQLVSFLGCAPAIELAPGGADQAFCHIGISPVTREPEFRVDSRDVMPRCPHCRHRLADWPARIEGWQSNPAHRTACPGCDAPLSVLELDWRQAAGFGRIFIRIFNIYPREALPTEALGNRLRQATGQSWNYFFQREE